MIIAYHGSNFVDKSPEIYIPSNVHWKSGATNEERPKLVCLLLVI